jgi:hypothetical protein
MKGRKSVFLASAVALFFAAAGVAGWAVVKPPTGPSLHADGTDPVPLPYPRPTRGLVADGTDPVPLPYPKKEWLADGTDPVPLPYPHRVDA